MSYKAFQDWYHESKIKHLLLSIYNNELVSPPFATELCKDYSTVWREKSKNLEMDLPPVTSKTNAYAIINNSMWMVPYGIYDEFNTVIELKDNLVAYHSLPFTGKGQFYSIASDGKTAFSFPLGYEGTNYGIYINDRVSVHKLPFSGTKLHMGTVYCNGRYWSMPRGDNPGYNQLLSFNGEIFKSYTVDVDNNITRKYSDIIVKEDTLYSLPFGETSGLNEVIEFDTNTETISYHKLAIPDFAKKFNAGVLIDDVIIALPYGDEHADNSNWGIVFDTIQKTNITFDINISYGGKYRYRSGIAYKENAIFFPSGTPSCPIFKISKNGNILQEKYFDNILFGRPVEYQDKLAVIAYNINEKQSSIFLFDEELNYEVLCTLA